LAQAPPLTVIVTDDGSPHPAEAETAGLAGVMVLHQANRGPGPARNTALEAVPAEAEYIAFLDSDDVWGPHHLARAVSALDRGYDFFFADLIRETDTDTHFGLNPFDVSRHRALGDDLYEFTGDFFDQTLTLSPVGTSTVVLRRGVLGDLRFPDSRDLWEDLTFWLEAARRTKRVAFDATVQATYGRGGLTVTESWKSNHELRNVAAYQRFYRDVAARFPLTPSQRRVIEGLRRHSHQAFCRIVIGMLRDRRRPDAGVVRAYIAQNPAVLPIFIEVVGSEAWRRMRRL